MAERFAAGAPGDALSEVFPPLLSMLTAVPVALGIDPFRAGQVVLAIAGALSLPFLVRGAEAVAPGTGRCAGCLALFAPLPVRFGAEVYTEPLFHLFTALAVWAGLRGRMWALGWAAGVAFWVRPEAALLVAGFALARPRTAWRAVVPLVLSMAVLAFWRGSHGLGYDLIAKVPFVWDRSVLGTGGVGAGVADFGAHVLRIPWLWLEAFGVVGLLGVWGILRARSRAQAPLYVTLALGLLLICMFLPRRRFLISWLAVVSPLAMVGFAAIPLRFRRVVFWAAILSSIALCFRTMEPNRAAERAVGEHLAAQLRGGETVTGDLTRVIYYAGQRPLAPRHFTVEELIAGGLRPEVRFVVLAARREGRPAVIEALAGSFERHGLPQELASAAEDRGIAVLARRGGGPDDNR